MNRNKMQVCGCMSDCMSDNYSKFVACGMFGCNNNQPTTNNGMSVCNGILLSN